MGSRHIARIANRIRFLVSSIILKELSDPRIGLVTILKVEPTQDLKEAKIFFSVYGDPAVRSRTCHAIERARGFIQKEMGKNLETRNTPRLWFILDETHEKKTRFENLMDKAIQEDQNIHGEETEQER